MTPPRNADAALTLLAILLLLFGLTFVNAVWRSWTVDRTASQTLVQELGLSDLSLFTEARYTRHPSQADRHAPFQDHPGRWSIFRPACCRRRLRISLRRSVAASA